MIFLRRILSYVCGLAAALATFAVCIIVCNFFDDLTHGRFHKFWIGATVVSGLILGIIVSDFVRNLIYEEPTVFH